MGNSYDSSGNLNNFKAVEITGKIMVIAIIILLVVVVAVLFLHLYPRWFWWRLMEEEPLHNRSRRRRHHFIFVPGQDPASVQRRGLDPAVLHSIPVVVYKPEDFREGLECAVCLCDVAEDERARILPKCNHGFHVECIDMWFQSHSTCPLCRNPVSSEYSGSNVESPSGGDEISENGSNPQASYLPVNMLFWGDEAQVSSRTGALDEPPCLSGESSSSERPEREGALVIEIPRQMIEDMGSSQDELKSPVVGRLRSFRGLLSRERRVNPCSPNGTAMADIEQDGRHAVPPC